MRPQEILLILQLELHTVIPGHVIVLVQDSPVERIIILVVDEDEVDEVDELLLFYEPIVTVEMVL